MNRLRIGAALILGALSTTVAAATLSAGDIVPIGFVMLNSGSYANSVRFTTLVQLPIGTVIKMTDRGWSDSDAFNTTTNEGVVTWTVANNAVPAGSVLYLTLGGSSNKAALYDETASSDLSGDLSIADSNDWSTAADALLTVGDNIFFFQDTNANPFFISGLNNTASGCTLNASNWCGAASNSFLPGSRLPGGTGSQNSLTAGTSAVGLPTQYDYLHYTGPVTSANRATWISRILDSANWSGDDTGTVTPAVSTSAGTQLSISSNTAPSLTLDSGSLSYTENASDTQVSSGATASDTEGNWNGGSLSINISANSEATDQLAISGSTGLFVNGTDMETNNNVVFGTINVSGGTVTGSTTLTVTFNANADNTQIQHLVRAIAYKSTSEAPSTSNRTVSFVLSDAASASTTQTRTINVSAVNDAPTVTASASISVAQTSASALTGISFADADAGSSSVTATLSVSTGGTFAATSGGGVTVTGSGTSSLSLAGSISNINSFISGSNVTFTSAGASNEALTIGINDGGNTGTGGAQTGSGSSTLTVQAANLAPTVSASATIAVTEDSASALTGISFADSDAGSGSLTASLSVGSGTLSATSGGGVTVTGSGTASMTLAGTLSDINTFISGSNVSFTTASNATADVALTIGINDNGHTGSGGAKTGSGSSTLQVSVVNDAPTVTVGGSIAVTEDTATALSNLSFADVDIGSGSLTVTLAPASGTLAATSGSGVTVTGSGTASMTLTGTVSDLNSFVSSVQYTPASNVDSNVTLSISLNDNSNTGSGGAQSGSGSATLALSAVNDAPTVTAPTSLSAQQSVAANLTGISFADVDVGSTSMTATLSTGSGTMAATSGGGVTVSGSGTNSLSLSGTLSDLNTFFGNNGVTFTNNTGTDTTLSIGINDNGGTGSGGSQSGSGSVNLLAALPNVAPTVSAPGTIAVTEDTATALTGISFADSDAGSGSLTASLSVGSGTLSATSSGGVTVTGSGSASLTLAGTLSAINTFISGSNLSFTTASNATANVTLTLGINDNGHTGTGGALTGSGSSTLQVSAVNDAPTLTAPGSLSVGFGALSPLLGLSVNDIDAGTSTLTLTLTVNEGVLEASNGGNVTVAGSNTGQLTLSGAQADLNAFLAAGKVGFLVTLGRPTQATLTFKASDGGHSGADPGLSGGANDEAAQVAITLNIGSGASTGTQTAPPGGSITVGPGNGVIVVSDRSTVIFPDLASAVGKTLEVVPVNGGSTLDIAGIKVRVSTTEQRSALSISVRDGKPVLVVSSGSLVVDSGTTALTVEAGGLRVIPPSQDGPTPVSVAVGGGAGKPVLSVPANSRVEADSRDLAAGVNLTVAQGGTTQLNIAGRQFLVEPLTPTVRLGLAAVGADSAVNLQNGEALLTVPADAQPMAISSFGANQVHSAGGNCPLRLISAADLDGSALTVLRCTITVSTDGADLSRPMAASTLVVYAGETVAFDPGQRNQGVVLGSRRAQLGMLGDGLTPGDASLSFGEIIPRLSGEAPVRPSAHSDALDLRYVNLAENRFGIRWRQTGQTSEGVFRILWPDGRPFNAIPTGRVKSAQPLPDGIAPGPEGTALVTIDGFTTRFAPSLASTLDFARRLARDLPGSRSVQRWNGSYEVTFPDGQRYVGRPGWIAETAVGAPEGFSVDASGSVSYTDRAGERQLIHPEFHDYDTVHAVARKIDPQAEVTPNMNGTVTVRLSGQTFLLRPEYELRPLPAAHRDHDLWVEGERVFLRNADGTAQAFRVR